MIESVEFHNFKVLRDSKLPLGRCTLIVGPNGSGKSTALQGLQHFRVPTLGWRDMHSIGCEDQDIELVLHWGGEHKGIRSVVKCSTNNRTSIGVENLPDGDEIKSNHLTSITKRIRVFSLDHAAILKPAALRDDVELSQNGQGLAAVLDRLSDNFPETWDTLNNELGRWFPEFDHILFGVEGGQKTFSLRLRDGQQKIPAAALSQGTLIALAMLTIAYLPDPPPIVGFEEPDRGLHPRLLRDVKQAMYRLAFPEDFDEERPPVQVIATTHSPYLLDLFNDHPEEIVICEKQDSNVEFRRLSEMPNIDEILEGTTSLGDVWYSGVLGGVPTAP